MSPAASLLPVPPAGAAAPDDVHQDEMDDSVPLGSLPAMYDPTFGGRLAAGRNGAHLLRVLHSNRDDLPQSWTVRSLRKMPFVNALLSRAPMNLKQVVAGLATKGLLRMQQVPGKMRDFRLVDIPDVDVHCDASRPGLNRLAAWMAYEQARNGAHISGGGGVRTRDLMAVVERHRIPKTRLHAYASLALRSVAELDPAMWRLTVGEASGHLSLSLRLRGACESNEGEAGEARTIADRVLPFMRARIAAAATPMICINQLSTADLRELVPGNADPRDAVTKALQRLCAPAGVVSGRPLVDVGIFSYRRWITVREHAEVATHCLEVRRVEGMLAAEQRQLRTTLRCAVQAVRREQLDALRLHLIDVEPTLQRAEAVGSSRAAGWIARTAVRVRQQVKRIEMMIEGAIARMEPTTAERAAVALQQREIGRADLADEAQHATLRWPTSVSQVTLARSVAKLATRFDGLRSGVTDSTRTGRRRKYPVFAVRAFLLGAVGDIDTRRLARRALRSLGPRPSVAALRAGLGEPHVEARLLAASGLGLLGGSEAVVDLERAARHDPEPGVREVAMWALSLAAPSRAATLLPECLPRLDAVGQQRARTWVEERERRGPVSWAD